MLNIPDLNRVKVFYFVYTLKSLVKAAEALNITRSAVSQSLKALEEEMGTKLFIRDSKRIQPTVPGEALFQSVEPFLNDLQSTVRQIETGKKEAVGHLRIGAPQDFGSTHLTDIIIQFRKKHPQISFELYLATPVSLLEQIEKGHLDLAFVDNGDIHAKNFPVSIVTVMKESFVLAGSREYLQKNIKRGNPNLGDLKKLDFIDYLSHAPVTKMWFRHQFGKTPTNLNIVFSAESVRAVIAAAKGGLGLAVVPEHMIEKDIESGRLKVISGAGRSLINQIVLARRLEKPTTAREKEFIDFYKNYSPLSNR
ncbi:LysR family transcriptional regulator [Bdellovibrio sp. HCB337]|uniref:LysR family transcriptional regulator n=1 Tax=Bdellovibrio sp. HCB337 TaxID=3394358 RepID=UPI0039A689E5